MSAALGRQQQELIFLRNRNPGGARQHSEQQAGPPNLINSSCGRSLGVPHVCLPTHHILPGDPQAAEERLERTALTLGQHQGVAPNQVVKVGLHGKGIIYPDGTGLRAPRLLVGISLSAHPPEMKLPCPNVLQHPLLSISRL